MATPTAPSCEIRRVIVHFYPDGLKGGAHPCEQQFFGKRGKPVKKMRFVPPQMRWTAKQKSSPQMLATSNKAKHVLMQQ